MRGSLLSAAVASAVVLLLASCGGGDGSGTPTIRVEGAVIPVPAGANGSLYLDIANDGDGVDRLLGVSTDAADRTEIHRTTTGDDGLARMDAVSDLTLEPGEVLSFAPGGLHVMLFGVDDLTEGDTVDVELELAESGTVIVEAEVGTFADVTD